MSHSGSAQARINGPRLWDSLAVMACIGATPAGGVTRLALSEQDRQGRDLFVRWAREAGCSIRIDAMGNIFARRAGLDETLAPVLTGSHGDSQPLGGRFDGIYGVLAGLEVVRALNDAGLQTRRPIEVVNWTNEEGSRFAPAMIGSGVACGVFDLEYGLSRTDRDGCTIGEALQQIGYAGAGQPRLDVHACFELHIEQGPILESAGVTIGVVQGGQGQRWYEGSFSGQAAHAGTTPMARRRDALLGLAALSLQVHQIGLQYAPQARATVGSVSLTPNSRNVVPGRSDFTVEFRHPDEAVLQQMDQLLRVASRDIAAQYGLREQIEHVFSYAPVAFDATCVGQVRAAAQQLGYTHQDIISGAGHDALYVSRIAPSAMIFIPCVEGLSHNEAEDILPPWCTAGGNVLLQAILSAAQ
ncbi:N-carbamoyl-L-amino-acid hydrolase [Herbaspirillum sp. Sphag1AN]|uniref:Zn-dependent hydrolase n=1 Tax=unclassified Herbaspirillum TaxID=2624150 RepID=UPI001612C0E8|nr:MULTISPECIES: Zn-dependent hydrolase [unclassified Herbaspirillum]MBB3211878.1 N-carbamoyl-L-amino-acid hydrolase [Herbaspirillum sp. Sphag1AN]MBB3244288.1 N-carbamoyl-L-amino-acid hydrolase [Herbaspirillum sp. Sphag64]